MDTEILRWMHGRLPVPEVVAHEIRDGKDWLLMTRTKGKMLCDPSVMKKPALLPSGEIAAFIITVGHNGSLQRKMISCHP